MQELVQIQNKVVQEMKQEYMTYQEEQDERVAAYYTERYFFFQSLWKFTCQRNRVMNCQQHIQELQQAQHINQEMQLMKQVDGMVIVACFVFSSNPFFRPWRVLSLVVTSAGVFYFEVSNMGAAAAATSVSACVSQ